MMNILTDKADVLSAVFSNATFKSEVNGLQTLEDLKNLLTKYDVVLTDEEVAALCKQIAEAAQTGDNDELSEEALENVAGGVWGYVVLGVVCLGAFALGVYNTL